MVRLVLLGASSGALVSCAPEAIRPRISPDSFYANDFFVPGVGYYHAPFRAFFEYRYNAYDGARHSFFAGGGWHPAPFQSIINISSPTTEAAIHAEAVRTDIERGGFGLIGGSSGYSGIG